MADWEWPAWLKANWIAMDGGSGDWIAFISEDPPFIDEDGEWVVKEGDWFDLNFLEFSPPPCEDWEQSLRRNPR